MRNAGNGLCAVPFYCRGDSRIPRDTIYGRACGCPRRCTQKICHPEQSEGSFFRFFGRCPQNDILFSVFVTAQFRQPVGGGEPPPYGKAENILKIALDKWMGTC